MSEVTPRDREEKLLAAIAEGATGKLPTPRNRKEKLLKEIYDNGSTGGGGAGGVTPEQVKAILLANTDNALNGASSNPIANKALVDALANYVKSTDLSIPTKVSELTNDKKYQTDSDLVTALTPYAKSDDVTTEIIAEIAKVVADAPEDFNTLKEMSDWISNHENDASAMNSAISDNKTAITALQTGKADKSEIPTTVSELTDSDDYAKKTDLHSHENKTVLDGITEEKVTYWDNKSEFSGSYNDLNDKPTIPKGDGTTITMDEDGTLHGQSVDIMTVDKAGIGKPDGDTIEVSTDATISVSSKALTFADHDTATSGTSFTGAEDGNIIVTDWTKNLLNPTLQTTTQNGVTCTNNGDGTYTLNGTATSSNAGFNLIGNVDGNSVWLTMPADGKIIFAKGDVSSKIACAAFKSEDSAIMWVGGIIPKGTNIRNIYFTVWGNQTLNNVVIKPMLTTDLSATYDDFVPYGGYEIQSCGKNLFHIRNDIFSGEATYSGVTFTRSNGKLILNGTSTSVFNDAIGYFDYIDGIDEYTFSGWDNSKISAIQDTVGLYSNNGYKFDFGNGGKIDTTIKRDRKINLVFASGQVFDNFVLQPIVIAGHTDLYYSDYEPYTGETITVTNDTESPAFGLKSHKGFTNIISPGNVKCVYPTNESGKGVMDSLYNKDKMLTEQNESLSVIGKCKNLLKPTLQTTTQNGVTCTRNVDANGNPDGTYTINGTSTEDSWISFAYITLNPGKYKFIATENNVGVSNLCVTLNHTSIATPGSIFTIQSKCVCGIGLSTYNETFNNVLVKPMITTNLSATYDDFVLYTGDGETLASDVAEIKKDLGGLTFSASGTTLTITDGTNTWTLGANS